ncbi:MAG: transglycosylase domain-containing protein, partial [Cetobacterium sp.]
MKWKILKYLAIFIISLGIVGGIGAALLVNRYYKELPNISELVENYSPPVPTTIYDRNGQVIDVISKETREPVDIENIPHNLQKAFMAIEDRQFLTHYGIDPFRILGSVIVNLKSGRAAQGGSTITQQLARNAFLSHEKKIS